MTKPGLNEKMPALPTREIEDILNGSMCGTFKSLLNHIDVNCLEEELAQSTERSTEQSTKQSTEQSACQANLTNKRKADEIENDEPSMLPPTKEMRPDNSNQETLLHPPPAENTDHLAVNEVHSVWLRKFHHFDAIVTEEYLKSANFGNCFAVDDRARLSDNFTRRIILKRLRQSNEQSWELLDDTAVT